MESKLKLSDELEKWHNEHPEEWVISDYARLRGSTVCYCVVGKAANLIGVPVDTFSYGGMVAVYMPTTAVLFALHKYAVSHGLKEFPHAKVTEANDTLGFETALEELRKVGL